MRARESMASAVALAVLATSLVAGADRDERAYAAGKFALAIGDNDTGWVPSVEGGLPTNADPVIWKKLSATQSKAQLSAWKYDDIRVTLGSETPKSVMSWLKKGFSVSSPAKLGSAVELDDDGNHVATLEWEGRLVELGLPALDKTSKDAPRVTIKIAPEYVRHKKGSGKVVPAKQAASNGKWLPAKFRFSFDGCGKACASASALGPMVLRPKKVEAGKTPQASIRPNLTVTFPAPLSAPIAQWAKKRDRRAGVLEYLTSEGNVLFSLKLHGLEPVAVRPKPKQKAAELEVSVAGCDAQSW